MKAYPESIVAFDNSNIVLKDGRTIKYNEGGTKTHSDLMNSNDQEISLHILTSKERLRIFLRITIRDE